MSGFRLPPRARAGVAAAAQRLVPARFAHRVSAGWLVVALIVVLTLGTGATAVTAVMVNHHGHAQSAVEASGPLPPAASGVLDPVQAPFAVNTPGVVKRHHGR